VDTASLEDSLINWLEEKEFAEAWKLGPMLAEANIQVSSLEELERLIPEDKLCVAMSDAMAALEREASALLVSEAADRIFRLVTAVKDYFLYGSAARSGCQCCRIFRDRAPDFSAQTRRHHGKTFL
jgi:hypothetical protein